MVLAIGLLYAFICSLDLMGSAFKLLGGKEAGEVFSQDHIITNPIAGTLLKKYDHCLSAERSAVRGPQNSVSVGQTT